MTLRGINIPYDFREDYEFITEELIKPYYTSGLPLTAVRRVSLWMNSLDQILTKLRERQIKGGQVFVAGKPDENMLLYRWAYNALASAIVGELSTANVINVINIDPYNFPQLKRDILVLELAGWDYATSFKKLELICQQRFHAGNPTFILTTIPLKDLDSIHPISSKGSLFQVLASYAYSPKM